MEDHIQVSVEINGTQYVDEIPARLLLADFIRERCGLVGTHLGCEQGICGACAVLLNGQSIRSCLTLTVQVQGSSILTIEGLSHRGELSPVQEAFWDHHALQCGFCTAGFVLSAHELLEREKAPTEEQIVEVVAGHICRCTGYETIIDAIAAAAKAGSGPAPTTE